MKLAYELHHVAGNIKSELEVVIERLETKIQEQESRYQDKQILKGESESARRVRWKDLADDLISAVSLKENFIKATNKATSKRNQIDENAARDELFDRIRAFFTNNAVSLQKLKTVYQRYAKRAEEVNDEDKPLSSIQSSKAGAKAPRKTGSAKSKRSEKTASNAKTLDFEIDVEVAQHPSRKLVSLPRFMFQNKYFPL